MDTRKEAKHPANTKTAPKGQSHWAHTMTLLLFGGWIAGAFLYGPVYSGHLDLGTFLTGLFFGWGRVIVNNFIGFLIGLVILMIAVAIFGPIAKKIEDKIGARLSRGRSWLSRKWNDRPEEPQKQEPPAERGSINDLFNNDDEEEATPEAAAATPEPEVPKTVTVEPATAPLSTAEDTDEKRLSAVKKLMPISGASDEQSFVWGAYQAFNGLLDAPNDLFASVEDDRKRGFAIGSMILASEAGA